MEGTKQTEKEVLKEESVGYLISKLNMQKGKLILTPESISLTSHKIALAGGGLLGFFAKKIVEKPKPVFDLKFQNIQSISQGKKKTFLEITDIENITYRIIVKNYQEWEDAIGWKR